jgi:hypothetical protein
MADLNTETWIFMLSLFTYNKISLNDLNMWWQNNEKNNFLSLDIPYWIISEIFRMRNDISYNDKNAFGSLLFYLKQSHYDFTNLNEDIPNCYTIFMIIVEDITLDRLIHDILNFHYK